MLKLPKTTLPYTLLRINLMVICEMVILHVLLLAVIYYFSRQALREEAMQNAEQTLEGTVQHIDNILLSVEQTTGNIYWELTSHLDQPERLSVYCQRLVESNPYVVGCAIAFTPHYYKNSELFMTYVHRKGGLMMVGEQKGLVTSDKFGNTPYTQQVWYTQPMESGRPGWTEPLPEEEDEGVTISFCVPIFDKIDWKVLKGEEKADIIGVVAVDVPVSLLSKIITDAKPTSHSYSIMLGRSGSYIVSPTPEKLENQTVFSQVENSSNPDIHETAKAMVAGETGYKAYQKGGENWYIFYKPFHRADMEGRSTENLGWSVGVIYPEEDIFGTYNLLFILVIGISVAGILLFIVLCRMVIRRQMQPLQMLTHSAQRIADGHLDEPIPDTLREDEIGQLQRNFKKMQEALLTQDNTLTQLTTNLQERNEVLQKADGQAQEADRMKTAFMHYMTNQMTAPADAIDESVTTLCNNYRQMDKEAMDHEVDNIMSQSDTMLTLLSQMIHIADSQAGKEEGHD